jgi:hypothetical protein
MMQSIELFDVLMTSGFVTTLLGLILKWRHDKKKAPLDREQVLSTASSQNVNDALAISAEYKEQLRLTREQMKEDAKVVAAAHERAMASLRTQFDRELASLREQFHGLQSANETLTQKVARLERDDIVKDRRIGKLEQNLGAAHQLVVSLMQYIRDHTTDTGSIPVVDYTIFES